MYRTVSNRALIALTFLLVAPAARLCAQTRVTVPAGANVLSSEIAMSRDRAELKLELDNGHKLTLATVTGGPAGLQRSGVPGDEIITLGVTRGDAVDASWRGLLERVMNAQTSELTPLLRDWHAPGNGSGLQFQNALDAQLKSGIAAPAAPVAPAAPPAAGMNDSVSRLQERIHQLQEEVENARSEAVSVSRHRAPLWLSPFRSIASGIAGIFATLLTYAVLFGIGFVVIMFGGRKYIEGVADTARLGVGRSFLVGLAGSFLLLPVFVLGIIALAISIVGIPALLVWIPLFPVAALAACLLGFLAIAHAAGESWAEHKYEGGEWISRANSYYFMATGLALMSALFIGAHVIEMTGPWLRFISGILNFFGVILTWGALTTGFGAVLISRGGKRPGGLARTDAGDFTEPAHA